MKSIFISLFVFLLINPSVMAQNRIAVVVNQDLYPSVKFEVDRLVQDLEDENNVVVLTEWAFNKVLGFAGYVDSPENYDSASELVDYLFGLYQEPDSLNGAILIGALPRRFVEDLKTYRNDYAFMHLDMDANRWRHNRQGPKIWVSRFWGLQQKLEEHTNGKEALLIKRMLDANHHYRKGLSRFPHKSITYVSQDTFNWEGFKDEGNPLLKPLYPGTLLPNLYSDNTLNSTGIDDGTYNALMFGSEFLLVISHGNSFSGGHALEDYKIQNQTPQTRFLIAGWTRPNDQGELGGIASLAMHVKNSGVVVAVGNSGWPYPMNTFGGGDFLQKLNQGFSFGDALLAHNFSGYYFAGERFAYFNGDLSLKAKMYPHNEMPTTGDFTVSESVGSAPFTTTFSNISGSDRDGDIVMYEIYPEGFDFGKISPAYAAATAPKTFSHTYFFSGRYLARVEVSDNYKARGYREIDINVSHDSSAPLRVNVGGYSSDHGFYDPYYWHDSNLDIIDSTGKLWRHDQEIAPGTWGRLQDLPRVHNLVEEVADTKNDRIFRERVVGSTIEYHFPIDNGDYKLLLGFMEPQTDPQKISLMDIYINDELQQSAFNVFVEAGGNYRAIKKSYTVNVTDNVLKVKVTKNLDSLVDAYLSAIEIVPVGHTNTPPQSDIITDTTSGQAPLTVNFMGQATDPDRNTLIYKWHFDDSETSTEIDTAHTFKTPGIYNVRLQVFDLNGGASESSVAINVLPNDSGAVNYAISADSSDNGSIFPTGEQTVEENDALTFTITPDAGYEIDQMLVDDVAMSDPTSTYKFSDVTANHTIHVSFKETNASKQFTVTTRIIGSGNINRPETHTVNAGEDSPWFAFSPAEGYKIDKVVENGVNLGARSSYTILNVQEDKLLEVHFVPVSAITHEITASAGAHGTISSPGVNQVIDQGSLTFTITPYAGYEINQVIVDGALLSNPVSTYTFNDVTADHTIRVSFKEASVSKQFTITTRVIGSGRINRPGTHTVNAGDNSPWFAFSPAEGYKIDKVVENGVNLGVRSSYTILDVQEDKLLEVYYVAIPAITYEITASAGANGTISSSGVNQVTDHGSLTFTITPNAGYEIDQVVVNGALLSNPVSTYTFSDVTANHTIHASFKEITVPTQFTITTRIIGSGSINRPGTHTVDAGDNSPWFAFYPADGHKIDKVVENGVTLSPRTSHTIIDVQKDKRLEVYFVPN